MGDGTTVYSELPYLIKRTKESSWTYDEGTDEAALLNNIEHCEEETLGKIYYIQAYYHNKYDYSEGTPAISQDMPYMVIGVNHDDTTNTVDLMSLVNADFRSWYNGSTNSWTYGKYSGSTIYSWLTNTCPNGYSANIQAKMCYMTERWREATGNATGTMMSRQTKCKLLNPIELWGYSAATASWSWQYANTSDYKTDFASPTGAKYGSLYPVWTDSISALSNRRIFQTKDMSGSSSPIFAWTNSWLAFISDNTRAYCFFIGSTGRCCDPSLFNYISNGVAPVIRLSQSPS